MFLQQLVNGIMVGSTYSLVAIGYTLIFGVLNVLHFAHGEVFMIGAFIGLQVVLLTKMNITIAIIAAMVGAGLLGMAIERGVIRLIKREYPLAPLSATIGLTVFFQEGITKIFGGNTVGFPETFQAKIYRFGNISIDSTQVIILAISFVLMATLTLFVKKTRTGKAIRAVAENPMTARLLGVNIHRVTMLTFAISSALAGAAGVLVGLAYNAISPFLGTRMALLSFAIMLLGGLGNITGAMAGGLILGVVEVLSTVYISSSYRDAFAFGTMILILVFRPSGLFGTKLQKGR
jgi:branched-chain amino acid transport system permease protein